MECPVCEGKLNVNRDYERVGSAEKFTLSVWCSECDFEEEFTVVLAANAEDATTVHKRMLQEFISNAAAGLYSNN